MKRSKKKREQHRDRLSELPDSLIYEIFGLLPMRIVVQTMILSKRWKNLWTTTLYLNFDSYHDSVPGYKYHASDFINRALILWKGFKVLKFKFCGMYDLTKSVFSDIDLWLCLAKENGVEELYLELYSRSNDEAYCVPHNLYSCASLKVLSLKCCSFENHGDVQWNKLKSLTIKSCLIDQNLIDKVMSGSPQLQVFNLNLCEGDDNLSIRSTSLKKLSIDREPEVEPSLVPELRIWCPNLETLDIVGMPHGKCALVNVSSLTHLTLDFYCHYRHDDDQYDDGYYGEIMGQILLTIQRVEKLTLSHWCAKVLGDMKEIFLLSPLSNCKFLTINNSEIEYDKIADLLHIFPELETFVLKSEYDYDPSNYSPGRSFLPDETNLPKSFLLQLKTVEITSFTSIEDEEDFIFTFIEFLLKHAIKLQKMVIRVKNIEPPPEPCFCAQKLLRMPRSSPTAKLFFAEC